MSVSYPVGNGRRVAFLLETASERVSSCVKQQEYQHTQSEEVLLDIPVHQGVRFPLHLRGCEIRSEDGATVNFAAIRVRHLE